MGFFSWNCPECGHSIMSPYVEYNGDDYLNRCTLVDKNGDVMAVGEYDGYGRITAGGGEFEINWTLPVYIYHTKCWKNRKHPVEESMNAEGQGYFFDDGDSLEEKK